MRKIFNTNYAFTLAEILIALTIIGVVAALTIPNVMLNQNAAQARTALKKAVASINQAILTSATEDGYDCAETIGDGDQSLYHIIEKHLGGKLLTANATKDDRWKIYANFMPAPTAVSTVSTAASPTVTSTENILPYSGNTATYTTRYYQLNDGMTLILPPNMASCGSPRLMNSSGIPTSFTTNANSTCIGYLDINGLKGPNQVIGCDSKPADIANEANDYIIATPGNPVKCSVKEKSITDVYPLVFYNDKVYPATYAAMTVLLDAQEDE